MALEEATAHLAALEVDRAAFKRLERSIARREGRLRRMVTDAFNIGADRRGGPWMDQSWVELGSRSCAASPIGLCAYDRCARIHNSDVCLFCEKTSSKGDR